MTNLITTLAIVATMTSVEISELTGKEHKNVIRDIRVMLDELEKDGSNLNHPQEAKDARGYTVCFYLNRELTEVLLTGYSATARLKVIRRWHELENVSPKFDPATLSRSDILRLALESEEARIKAEAERDQAIATKAEIGSRREATAMATASAAVRSAEKLKIRLSETADYATVRAIKRATGHEYDWAPLSRWCATNNPAKKYAADELYGQVRTWPAGAWLAAYGVDIRAVLEVASND